MDSETARSGGEDLRRGGDVHSRLHHVASEDQVTAGRGHVSSCKNSSPGGSSGSEKGDLVNLHSKLKPPPPLKTETPVVIQGDVLHISQQPPLILDHVLSKIGRNSSPGGSSGSEKGDLVQPPPILDHVLSKIGRNPCVIVYNSSVMKFLSTNGRRETTPVHRPEKRHRSSSRESSKKSSRVSDLHQQHQRKLQEGENCDPRTFNTLPSAKKQKVNLPSTIISPPPPPLPPGVGQQLAMSESRQSSDITPSTVETMGMDVVTSFMNFGIH